MSAAVPNELIDAEVAAAHARGLDGDAAHRAVCERLEVPEHERDKWRDAVAWRLDKLRASSNGAPAGVVRTRGVALERVRPVRWLWKRRIPCGLPSIIVGEEGIGKGLTAAWIIARATRGQLDGDHQGEPVRVLVVGDEDGFDQVWVPRLYAAGADLERVLTLDDGEHIDDLAARAAGLSATIERDGIGCVVFDQLLDHVSGGKGGQDVYNPKHVRASLLPLRRVAGKHDIAALGLMHPPKGAVTSFRQLVGASHQFNAVSRSSLLLAEDPDDPGRRVLVRGKGNHSAAPRSFEYRVAVETFDLNGHGFEVPKVVDEREGERTIKDLLEARQPGAAPTKRDQIKAKLDTILDATPQTLSRLAEQLGCDRTNRTLRLALDELAENGDAVKIGEGWITG